MKKTSDKKTAITAIKLTYKFLKKRGKSQLYWSIGLWLFGIGVLLEVIFSFNIYNAFLIKTYLAAVYESKQ